jgi:TM2 domain-containing membrane protein YozV
MRRMAASDHGSDASQPAPRRSLATAYLVWFLVGVFGGHRFYLGDGRGGRWFLIGLAVGLALPVAGLAIGLVTQTVPGVTIALVGWVAGLIVLLGVLAAAIVDAFRLPQMTRDANADAADADVARVSEPR